MDGGGWEGKIAHGKDIFRKVKDLQVGQLRRREQEESEREKGKRSDSVELIDLSEIEEGDATGMHLVSLRCSLIARCCSPIAITCTSDLHVPHYQNKPYVGSYKPTKCHSSHASTFTLKVIKKHAS